MEPQDESFYLTPEQVEFFHEQGYIGPFRLYSREFIEDAWNSAKLMMPFSTNKPHDAKINYDRHLDVDLLSAHVCRKEIVHRVVSLLGPDVMCWRTEFFPKYPKQKGTGWHQERTFQLEENKPLLKFPASAEIEPMEATVWAAFTDARVEHGCLRLIPGSHKHEHYDDSKITLYGTDESHDVYGYNFIEKQKRLDWDPEKEKHLNVELDAGEFIIFASRTVHGSLANTSNRMRLGFTVRYISPSVKVYDGVRELREHGEVINLDYAGCVLVAGEDRYGHNKRHQKSFNGYEFTKVA